MLELSKKTSTRNSFSKDFHIFIQIIILFENLLKQLNQTPCFDVNWGKLRMKVAPTSDTQEEELA